MKKILLSFFMCMLAIIGMQAETATASLSFADKAQRTSFSTDKQVWEQNGIILTNNKGGSSSNVGDYSDPARFYKNSEIIIEFTENITKIEFVCSTTGYATSLQKSIESNAVAESSTVTVTLDGTSNKFTIAQLSDGKVFLYAVNIFYNTTGEGGGDEPETPVEPTPEPVVPELGGKYTIVFNNTDGSDGNDAATPATFVSTYILSSDIVALSCTETNNCFKGKANYGLKMSSSKASGSFTLAFEKEYYVKSVVINAVRFRSDEAASLSVNNSQAKSLTDSFTDYMFDVNSLTQTIKVDMTKRGYIKSMVIDIVCPENITSNNCYVVKVGDVWEEPAGCWYAAKFINKNTGEFTWSAVSESDAKNHGYLFYLAPGNTPLGHEPQLDPDYKYTHVEFVQLPATVEAPADIRNLDLTDVEYKTSGEIWYDGKPSKVYSLVDEKWLDEATGVNRVEMAAGIGYAYGVVSAEGAIEVYNVNGAVVARGNDNVDLRGLGRGVYIIRNGNQVRKVVR